MDSSDPTFSNAKIPSKRTLFYQTVRRQEFPFPDSLIYYITKNPASAKGYKKTIQSCKYFFVTNPLLIVTSLSCFYKIKTLKWNIYFNYGNTLINLENILCQLWITDNLYVNGLRCEDENVYNFMSSIIPKIYRCEVKKIIIRKQNISLKEYIFLASNVKDFACEKITIKNDNGSIVVVEDLVAAVPKVKVFRFEDHILNIITPKTVQELLRLPHFLKLDIFFVENITESFDIEALFAYAKTNKHTKLILHFCDHLSETYTNRLRKIINEIVDSEIHNYKIPRINFSGSSTNEEFSEKYFKLLLNQPW